MIRRPRCDSLPSSQGITVAEQNQASAMADPPTISATGEQPVHLERRLGLFQATALNMANMIGVGPFITIPILMSALGGPQAMLGWLVAILITIPDSLVWSELGAMMPGSGGSYG